MNSFSKKQREKLHSRLEWILICRSCLIIKNNGTQTSGGVPLLYTGVVSTVSPIWLTHLYRYTQNINCWYNRCKEILKKRNIDSLNVFYYLWSWNLNNVSYIFMNEFHDFECPQLNLKFGVIFGKKDS